MAAPQTAGTPEPKKTAKKADDFDIYKHCGVTKRFATHNIRHPDGNALRFTEGAASVLTVGQSVICDRSSGVALAIEICNDYAFTLITVKRGEGMSGHPFGYIVVSPGGVFHEVRP